MLIIRVWWDVCSGIQVFNYIKLYKIIKISFSGGGKEGEGFFPKFVI